MRIGKVATSAGKLGPCAIRESVCCHLGRSKWESDLRGRRGKTDACSSSKASEPMPLQSSVVPHREGEARKRGRAGHRRRLRIEPGAVERGQ
jgi:hypothetical protein